MRFPILVAFALSIVSPAPLIAASDDAAAVAREAVDTALALPSGYKRDRVLRAISRNLRWSGQPDEGVRAARAMTDRGIDEAPVGAVPAPPRYVPLREAMPSGNACDAGMWREDDGGEARTPRAREAWARRCLLERDFHWIGLPEVAQVRAVATALPDGETKVEVLAMLIRLYRDADTLRFAKDVVARARLSADAREGLTKMLAEPVVLYLLGDTAGAVRAAGTFADKAEFIVLLVANDDAPTAIAVFETIAATPPEELETCFEWFSPIGGIRLERIGNTTESSRGLGRFLDLLATSPLFRKVCPTGLDADTDVALLLAAGRNDAAIARARAERGTPFLLVDALLVTGEADLRRGARDAAQGHAIAAGAALPPFDPGDPVDPVEANGVHDMSAPTTRRYGETDGNIGRRFRVVRLMAATGAVAEADALARAQSPGALRAVALSAAVAGRAGMRFDDQAPTLETVDRSEL